MVEAGFEPGSNDFARQLLFTVPRKLVQSDSIFEVGMEDE